MLIMDSALKVHTIETCLSSILSRCKIYFLQCSLQSPPGFNACQCTAQISDSVILRHYRISLVVSSSVLLCELPKSFDLCELQVKVKVKSNDFKHIKAKVKVQ